MDWSALVMWVNDSVFAHGFPGGSVMNLPAMQETWVWSLGWEDLLEKGIVYPP